MDRRKFLQTAFASGALFAIDGLISNSEANETFFEGTPIFKPEIKTVHGQKHTPFIDAPKKVKAGEFFEVRVITGYYHPHPNKVEHHIEWSSLYINAFEAGQATFKATISNPDVTFKVKIDSKGKSILRAFSYCNIHGLWLSFPKEIEVV
ncbi:class II SORL domain-containing protein [Persephonella sp.]|uniref:class II SORL domain-containing protein n=1 Tax=Persephonella sp. TaxID=2060922 RepID=UPI0026182F9A|nr:class II SORL domain-containing protein [Persephonella sp.]